MEFDLMSLTVGYAVGCATVIITTAIHLLSTQKEIKARGERVDEIIRKLETLLRNVE